MHLARYDDCVVFDQATKLAYACVWVHTGRYASAAAAYADGRARLAALSAKLAVVPNLQNAKVRCFYYTKITDMIIHGSMQNPA